MTTTTIRPTTGERSSPANGNVLGERPGIPGRGRWLTLGLLVSAQFVVMLDTSIVNVALPSIQTDLGLGAADATWVVNAYVVAFGGLLLLSGRVADLFGRRGMFTAGSALFTVGTLLAAGAADQGTLLAGRVVQGVGAAALSPAAMSLLMLGFPGRARARAMSIWGAASTLGGATGVVLGGLLAGALGWRSVFLVTVPISLVAVVVARHVLPESSPGPRRRFDWGGAASITAAVVVLVHGALFAADLGWTARPVVGSLVVAAALMASFVLVERRIVDPLVPLELFRSGTLSVGVALALLGGAARASTFVLVALYLQQALAMAPQEAGLAMVPTSLAGFAVSLGLLPWMLRTLGPRRSLVIGLVVLAAGHLWLAYAPTESGYLVAVLPGLLLVATGVALSFTPTTMVVASAVPEAHTGLASGLAGSASQVGAALGTASFTAVGLAFGMRGAATLTSTGFAAAFTAAAVVALATAALGFTIARGRTPVNSPARPHLMLERVEPSSRSLKSQGDGRHVEHDALAGGPHHSVVASTDERTLRVLAGSGPHVRGVRHVEPAGARPQRLQLRLQPLAQPVARTRHPGAHGPGGVMRWTKSRLPSGTPLVRVVGPESLGSEWTDSRRKVDDEPRGSSVRFGRVRRPRGAAGG